MLPLFPHEDRERAVTILECIQPLADAFWQTHDPATFKTDPDSVMLIAMLSPHKDRAIARCHACPVENRHDTRYNATIALSANRSDFEPA